MFELGVLRIMQKLHNKYDVDFYFSTDDILVLRKYYGVDTNMKPIICSRCFPFSMLEDCACLEDLVKLFSEEAEYEFDKFINKSKEEEEDNE